MQVLYEMKRQGHAGVAAAWREAGLTWAEFLPEATEVTNHAYFLMPITYFILDY
jgi:hypothetical protein